MGWYLRTRGRPVRSMARRPAEILSLNEARCFGCAACIAICPVDALDLSDLLVVIDEPICTHCELCIPICPVYALFFESIPQNQIDSVV